MPTEVTRTHLEMTSPSDLRPAPAPALEWRIARLGECTPSFFRYLYLEVGRAYHWVDRLAWSDEEVRARLADPRVSLHLLSVASCPAGYFELERRPDGSVEIAYFGLLPGFLGRGLGKHLLSEAVQEAWRCGATRVCVHTCTLDDPAALPNYLGRGFRPIRTETYSVA
jgi:GNAT superfamily N-acetyltransferase